MNSLIFTSLSTATAYHFRGARFGWAVCTINEASGELLITSSWGNWAHRWPVGSLGEPSLTVFIARGDVDYLARKLQGGGRSVGKKFSSSKTVASWRKALCRRRLEEGRKPHPKLSRQHARLVWFDLDELEEIDNRDLFIQQAYDHPNIADWITDVPYEDIKTEQTLEDRALRETILPGLIKVLRARSGAEAPDPQAEIANLMKERDAARDEVARLVRACEVASTEGMRRGFEIAENGVEIVQVTRDGETDTHVRFHRAKGVLDRTIDRILGGS